MSELLPCHCGGAFVWEVAMDPAHERRGKNVHAITCSVCAASTGFVSGEDAAERIWRRLTAAPALDEAREREAFEEWVCSNGMTIEKWADDYSHDILRNQWLGWLAAKKHARGEG